jgi:hypothetical protein
VLVSFVYVVACRLFALVLLLGRSDGSKELEIILLRHELAILRRVGCVNSIALQMNTFRSARNLRACEHCSEG